ncbi:rhodopsin, GQ-coupled-like [Mercenaria mercenaria]|uniref:rhodopsin, GQ-coupled-like n=1 Tax=Mercenaria mercenaria TaxID=6596 RepID=UPI00234FAF5F|nr:rhodopsin, GQ-coupled-like [Mercenaria mercenaria]XP_045181065.2 rhodopsin, GQ-coupled-like [Mercenaria mercenaria]XP_045181066.2 rhodopsin, GQ-coupled-like [Mercenaria mercenaria]XP_045181067.2 rhodopsin, GQ-coupled-like [Mercenaria mercenaria]XP_045181068.2 rhodopsin, GQ-coupled-like [Mercenaria mercenaria]XP_045181069.2 rhodopsin, GQ-coupled-like [Mercenaria mercenaria]
MYTTIPKDWRNDFGPNVTIEDLNDVLVQLHIPTIVFIAILMVVGVFGNMLVLYIYTTKYHPSTYRSFILWLGWIDLIACSVGMPLLIVSMLYPYMFPSEEACKTLRFLHVFFVVSSAFIVIAIAIERHRRICNPFSVEMTPNKIKLMCLVASILGCLVAIPAIFVYGDAVVDTGVHNITGTECFIDPEFKNSNLPKGYFIFQLLLSVVSMVVMGIFYFRIGTRIIYHHKFIRENTYQRKDSSEDNKGKTKETICESTNKNGVSNGHDHHRKSESPQSSNKNSRETTPTKKSLDDIEIKKDPYGDLLKKVVKSRSNSPAPRDSSRESTPKQERMNRQRNRIESNKSEKSVNSGPSLRTKQVTFMLFIITVVFILSFIPHLVLMVINSMNPFFVKDMSPTGIAIYNVFLRSFVINNMANPIIYGFCDKKFRSECADFGWTILTCGRR